MLSPLIQSWGSEESVLEQGHGRDLSLNYTAGCRLTQRGLGKENQAWKDWERPASPISSLSRCMSDKLQAILRLLAHGPDFENHSLHSARYTVGVAYTFMM